MELRMRGGGGLACCVLLSLAVVVQSRTVRQERAGESPCLTTITHSHLPKHFSAPAVSPALERFSATFPPFSFITIVYKLNGLVGDSSNLTENFIALSSYYFLCIICTQTVAHNTNVTQGRVVASLFYHFEVLYMSCLI